MIRAYLRYRRAVFCFYLLVSALVPLMCFAYRVDMELAFYTVAVISFVLVVGAAVDGSRFYRKTEQLREIERNLSQYTHRLPQDANLVEQLYGEIITSLYRMLEENTEALGRAHYEQLEYYTRWLHQIKTPIAAIRLKMQGDKKRDPVLEQELFKIEQYVEMALQYVKMGDFSSDLVVRAYPLREIVNRCVKKYSTLFIYKKLSVSIEVGGTEVTTDGKWLSFILEQLLSNAIKYTPSGTIRITSEGNTLSVIDEGIGIREEDRARIFEKGFTGYNGRQDRRASGIGLYMAKKAADRLSIRLAVSSTVGKGTRVTLFFPDRKEEADL